MLTGRTWWMAGLIAVAAMALVFFIGWWVGHRGEREAPAPRATARAAVVDAAPAAGQIDPIRRGIPVDQEATPPPMARVENVDLKRQRAYPMQPPTIPHSIENYQVDKNSNRCMLCHARANAEQFQAPPVSVTHYMDRDDQFLAAISPRRYFCNQCHVVQTDARLLVGNDFKDIDALLAAAAAEANPPGEAH
ncbi:nitrate reductase cytochrome c-type subunit [Lysobacter sp. A6]|uniref:Periplasmic nitrate reductase, electron transfer subunit n=1 Tax=Noviluteimonas lactosilytica TaxID=2888523 RepID=A0ABS8JJF5_9GAMM|nr:nitrate reductase cytochrome c-type subunit [Lysobacter lactosilyticus]MCC8363731.1 nitrate reductase cytochrome c-type subunit [Lysobacter lactosilyticus]